MTLVDNWKEIALKAWSFRIAVLLAVIQSIEAGYDAYASGQANTAAIIGAFIAFGGALSRLVAQESISK